MKTAQTAIKAAKMYYRCGSHAARVWYARQGLSFAYYRLARQLEAAKRGVAA